MEFVLKRTFAALTVRNFRLYLVGQGISLCGTWMQTIGLTWLVLKMTSSGIQLGLVVAAQFLPVLLFGVWGGVIADRFNKRKILYFTQSIGGVLALILGLLVVSGEVRLWMIYVLAAALGLSMAIDSPSRQTFVMEMVGNDKLKNAVTLNSIAVNAARVVGPSIAGVLIATVGIGPCFLINAASYVAVLGALLLMRQRELYPVPRAPRAKAQIREGIRYILRMPQLRSTLVMMFIIGTFAYEFPVILPLFATGSLHGNATTYSVLMVSMSIGAVIGGLYVAGRGPASQRLLVQSALAFGLSIMLTAVAPNIVTACVTLLFVGALSVLFISLGNTTLQLNSEPAMRGRVMSFWSIAFQGTTPIGGPLVGLIADHSNPRFGLLVGGASALVAAALGLLLPRSRAKK